MSHPTPVLRGISLSARQLEGLHSILLEAMTSGDLGPSEIDLAVALREGLDELRKAVRESDDVDAIGLLLPTEYGRVALSAVQHVFSTLLPFEIPMRVHLDTTELESLMATLLTVAPPSSA